jgi:hypothetical protein
MTQNTNLHPDLGTFAQWYGIPINVAPPPGSGVTPTFLYDSESDHPTEGYPIDQNTYIEGGPGASSGSDRHALVVGANLCKLYEIYNLQNFTNGQQPQAGSGAVWDLSSDAMRPIGWTSADAAGLPIAPQHPPLQPGGGKHERDREPAGSRYADGDRDARRGGLRQLSAWHHRRAGDGELEPAGSGLTEGAVLLVLQRRARRLISCH